MTNVTHAPPWAPTDAELDQFREVQRLAYRCAEEIAADLQPGVTEKETASQMRRWGHAGAGRARGGHGMSSLTSLRVSNGDVELAVADSGVPGDDPDAPTVILVHGYPDNSAMWLPVAKRLEGRYRVVTYDVRGAGASTTPRNRSAYALDHLVEDLAAVAGATSPDRPVHVVGHDWGSIQLWEAVTTDTMAGRIASFTSISGPCLDHVGNWVRARLRPRPRALRQLARQGLRSWYVAAFHLPGTPLFWRLGGDRLVARSLKSIGELPPDSDPSPTLRADGAHGINLYQANMSGRLTRPRERRTEVPVQLLVPTDDRYVTPALLDDTARWVPNLWRRDVPGGHWITRRQPERVARWIGELVDHVEGGAEPPSLRLDLVARP